MALVKRGLRVTVLDGGKTLEPERQAVLERLGGQRPEEWTGPDLDRLRGEDQTSRHGAIHSKMTYGSEYPYEDVGEPIVSDPDHVPFHYSMARGGLSNVWGASLLPSHQRDMEGWPVTAADLAEHYRAVLGFMPSTGVRDELEELLPAYVAEERPLKPSRQIEEFLRDLRGNRAGMRRAGIHFGRSRVAVEAEPCVYCGLCLYGCPYSLIYSSASTLKRLMAEGSVEYRPGHVVERLESTGSGVRVHARDAGGNAVVLDAERVFVGAGVIPSAWLALNSLGAFDEPVTMLDSQYFIFPFFRLFRTAGVDKEPLASLVQAYLEISDARVSKNLVHVEVFSYSDFLKRALMATPLRFALFNRWMESQMFDRLLVLQCFLHSDESSRLTLRLERPGNGGQGRPKLAMQNDVRRGAYWAAMRAGMKLAANGLKLRGVPVVPAMQFAEPGRSYHSGGTFPMRAKPGRLETDVLGQMPGLPGVHFVDATVFPSIPATTITLTVMANAHRIATQAGA